MKNRQQSRLAVAAMVVAASVLLFACGDYNGTTYTAPASTVQVVSCATVTADQTVDAISTTSFVASAVTISVNQVVQWNNSSGFAHTVTSTVVPLYGTFNAALPSPGSVCLKFTAAGAFNYFCSIHPGMTGSVTVN